MAIEDCEFCGCIQGNMSTPFFQQAVLSVLCDILGSGGVTEAVNIASVGGVATAVGDGVSNTGTIRVAEASQQATFAAAAVSGAAGAIPTTGIVVLANVAQAKILTIGNTLDVAVLISADGGVTYPFYVPSATGTMVIDFKSNDRWTALAIFAKAIGSNSSSGTLYVGLTI